MHSHGLLLFLHHSAILTALMSIFLVQDHAAAATPGQIIIPMLQERLGLTEGQARGAVGALLVFVRERLPKVEFDDVSATIPNAERIMQDVKLRGIVTRPLDTLDDYEAALASLGIGPPLAARIAPTVLQLLTDAGYVRERDMLSRALN